MKVETMHGCCKDFFLPALLLVGFGILIAAFKGVLFTNSPVWLLSGMALGGLVIWFAAETIILQEVHWLHSMRNLPVITGCLMKILLIPHGNLTGK